jgi:hypothetical protein
MVLIWVGIAQSVYRRDTDWMESFSVPAGHDFSLLHWVQSGSGSHTASSYPMGTWGDSPVVKLPTHIKNGGAIPPLPNNFTSTVLIPFIAMEIACTPYIAY